MRIALPVKFVLTYVLIGILGFVLFNTLGASAIEKYALSTESSKLYSSVTSLANTQTIRSYQDTSGLRSAHELLQAFSEADQVEVLIIDMQGRVVLDTATDFISEDFPSLEGFDPTASQGNYYTVDDYFGHYSDKQINVTAPITINMTTRGYISIHEPYTEVIADRESLLTRLLSFYVAAMLLFAIFFVPFFAYVQKPLTKVIHGAREFASGQMSYRIPIHSNDEMGYLANTLNYMADEMQQNDQFQKDFISNVSHDFRSPLTSIKGYVEAIADGTIPYEMQKKYLDIVLFETARLTKLTQSMLQLNDLDAKAYMLKLKEFDLNPVIKSTAASFEGICRQKKISIKLLLSSETEYVTADEEKIQQVLYNLLDNAIKFSDKNTEITVELTRKNEKLLISVKDQGSGIPSQDLSKIWTRFYKQDISRGKDRTGTGLGLSIVKEIINTHKQTIDVISTPGAGTEFIFTLDRARMEEENLLS